MKTNKIFKLITAVGESVLGIPVIGGTIILHFAWTPLAVMFILHIITLALCLKEDTGKLGSISGIVANVFGWIPFAGMILHIITAVLLWIGVAGEE